MIISSTSDSNPVLVCAADDGFAMPLAVTVCSTVANVSPLRKLDLYILDGGVSAKNKERVARLCPEDRARLHWVSTDLTMLGGLVASEHVTEAAYFRLLIPSLLPRELTRVIYLDADLLVLGDVGELWDMDLGDWYCLASQDTAAPFIDASLAMNNYCQCLTFLAALRPVANYCALGLDPFAKYFNSGVMVVPLNKWREENISEHLFRCLRDNERHVLWWDQYALNVVLAGKWGELEPRWNLQGSLYNYPSVDSTPCGRLACRKALEEPRIVHFNSPEKPWRYGTHHPFRDEYFRYLDKTDWAGWRPTRPPFSLRRWLGRRYETLYKTAQRAYRHWSLVSGH